MTVEVSQLGSRWWFCISEVENVVKSIGGTWFIDILSVPLKVCCRRFHCIVQGFLHRVVKWHGTTLLLFKPFDVVNGMYKECKKPLIIFLTQWAKTTTLLKISGETMLWFSLCVCVCFFFLFFLHQLYLP